MAYSTTGYDQTLILDFLQNDPSWATAKPWFRPENYFNVGCGALSKPDCLARFSSLTPDSRLYIVGHGDKNEPYLMTDKRELIHFTSLANILGSVLINPDLKINKGTGNLTISFVACETAGILGQEHESFAAQLQLALRDQHGIYANIFARLKMIVLDPGVGPGKYTIRGKNQEKYNKLRNRYKRARRDDTRARYLEEQRCLYDKNQPVTKRYLSWRPDGYRHAVNAYAYFSKRNFRKKLWSYFNNLYPNNGSENLLNNLQFNSLEAMQASLRPFIAYLRSLYPLTDQDTANFVAYVETEYKNYIIRRSEDMIPMVFQ